MPEHLYAETLLTPELGVSFQWRYQNNGRHLLAVLDRESPVHDALEQAIERFEGMEYAGYRTTAQGRAREAQELVDSLQV